jgi:hypothetical protein
MPMIRAFRSCGSILKAVGLSCFASVWVSRLIRYLLWDADFLLGQREVAASERYVLCEINVSSVAPFTESAIRPLVEAIRKAILR